MIHYLCIIYILPGRALGCGRKESPLEEACGRKIGSHLGMKQISHYTLSAGGKKCPRLNCTMKLHRCSFMLILSIRSLIMASWHLIKRLLSSHWGQNILSTKRSRKYNHMVFRNSPQTTAIEKHIQAKQPLLVKNLPGSRGLCQRVGNTVLGGPFRQWNRKRDICYLPYLRSFSTASHSKSECNTTR